MSVNEEIWKRLDSDGFYGLEAFVGDATAFDVISYDGSEFSWMLREWESDGCYITASYDEDLYYDTCDEALAALLAYIQSNRSEIWEAIQSHPIRDSLREFADKALRIGFAMTLAFTAFVGVNAMTPDTAEAFVSHTHTTTTMNHAHMATLLVFANSARHMNNSDDFEDTTLEYDLVDYEEMDGWIVADGADAEAWFEDAIGVTEATEFGEAVIYQVAMPDGTDAVAIISSENDKIVVNDSEIVNLCYSIMEKTGADGIKCESLEFSGHALGDALVASNFKVPTAFVNHEVSGGAAVVFIVAGIAAIVVFERKSWS